MYTSFLIGPHNTAITHDEKTGLSTRPYQDNLVQILLTENKIELIKSKINSSMHELKETNKPIFDKYLFKATAIISLYILITIFLNPNLLLFLLLIILEPYYLIKSTTNS